MIEGGFSRHTKDEGTPASRRRLTRQGFRKSLRSTNDRQTVIGNGMVSPKSIAPPKKVIRAIRDYIPQSSRELAFSKGDFFHVVGSENDRYWYEACNPATNMRGLVPVDYFEEIGKTVGTPSFPSLNAAMTQMSMKDQDSRGTGGYNGYGTMPSTYSSMGSPPKKPTPVYGVVQYDFVAEQKDELNVKAGESIIVIAQSNHEWFVCKPIGRLGGPGLIPISFIEIRDVATGKAVENIEEFMAKSGVPRVEEWKQKLGEYKSKSIPLGHFDFNNSPPPTSAPLSAQSRQSQQNGRASSPISSPKALLAVKDARIEQCSYTNGRYWYWVRAVMEDGHHRNLCRFYEDFYSFQLTLLATFPIEAGATGRERILPFIPGPTQYVTDAIAEERRDDLDVYVRELCLLPLHIKTHDLVKSFFAPRDGDVESSRATNMAPQPSMAREVGRSSQTSANRTSNQTQRSLSSQGSGPRTQPLSRSDSSPTRGGASASVSMSKTQTEPSRNVNGSRQPGSSDRPLNTRPPPPFIKIKIFFQDDIIVIRTPPDVSYDHLIEKMTDRLGKPFRSVRYRDSMSGDLYDITNDGELAAALQTSEKLVLIAD